MRRGGGFYRGGEFLGEPGLPQQSVPESPNKRYSFLRKPWSAKIYPRPDIELRSILASSLSREWRARRHKYYPALYSSGLGRSAPRSSWGGLWFFRGFAAFAGSASYRFFRWGVFFGLFLASVGLARWTFVSRVRFSIWDWIIFLPVPIFNRQWGHFLSFFGVIFQQEIGVHFQWKLGSFLNGNGGHFSIGIGGIFNWNWGSNFYHFLIGGLRLAIFILRGLLNA